ncbi:MAG: hypothetical protein K9N23_04825 [Akkermansiaceae bacterium]|nr:hypothetical protein [Akkermansiaceae bacterium]MCF7730985.1 hypothetical protein [Akkermansiaceae bacterium]
MNPDDTPPVDPESLYRQATERLRHGADSEILSELESAVARFPGHPGLALRHADALHLEGRLAEAAGAYRRVIGLDGTCYESWYGLGSV